MIDVKQTNRIIESLREPRRLVVAVAIGAALITNVLIGVAWAWQADAARSDHIQALGQASAAQLATLSVEPLISIDSMRLGVLATRLASLPTVRLAAVHTLDDRIVALAGSEAPGGGHVFKAAIEFEGETAGYARVVLDDAAISGGLSFSPVVALMALLSTAACGLLAHLLPRTAIWMPAVRTAPEPPVAVNQETFLLVVNLFNMNRIPGPERLDALRECRQRLDQVARPVAGRIIELPGTGWLVVFNVNPRDADHAFGVVLHSLLAAEVLDEFNEDCHASDRLELIFRFGLHDIVGAASDAQLRRSEELADAVVLSAVAPNGCIAASESVFERVLRPERLIADELTNPVLSSLSTTRSDGCVVISTTADTSRPVLDRALHAYHQTTTSSVSTF